MSSLRELRNVLVQRYMNEVVEVECDSDDDEPALLYLQIAPQGAVHTFTRRPCFLDLFVTHDEVLIEARKNLRSLGV
ncbi:hypothetical protein LJ739_13870 [Aestuariibacter halophilus]|uniref:Uncharacterized protein n=1 Tax=Fluctibacter halophilus TaxID=226011 RepID=A0ABS8GAX9_9ALTE|nr:hypothetical protein [Aestuariibacter halophilus]MCC2617336.1 hypothetical protein [Aestuariibacter halophilus]